MKRLFFIVMLLGMYFHANAYHWDVNINTYPNTMSIIGVVTIDGEEQNVNTLEIGAFSGDECRGRGLLTDQYYAILNHYYIFLTVYGNDGDALSFRIYDHELGEELEGYCSNSVTFTTNGTLGDPGVPYVFEYASSGGDEYHWDVNVHQYATTMTICGIIEIDGVEQLSEALEIGAFCNNECRGREKPISQYYSLLNHYYVFMTIYGNDGDQLNFRLYDHSIGQELDLNCTNVINFATNATLGDPGTPYEFEFFSQTSNYTITATANPTQGGTISGTGSYQNGQTCTLTATANTGYAFAYWTENGTVVSANAVYSFTVTGNRSLVANFRVQGDAPIGAINGLFSINNNNTQVYFSQGNLQYQATTNNWRFAPNQFDRVGDDNSNISPSYNGWIDLFGWGTGNNPTNSSTNSEEYNTFNEWGNNTISNGDNTYTWRTLTDEEWGYVYFGRNTTSGIRFALAQVDNVCGLILLPDNWNSNLYSLDNVNSAWYYDSNIISASDWVNIFESNGAVFLPAAGGREDGTFIEGLDWNGEYWSSTSGGAYNAYHAWFHGSNIGTDNGHPNYYGKSVRLVHQVGGLTSFNINATPNPAEGGTVNGGGTYQEGSLCTLTATANTGYEFVNWTENGTQVSTNATYSFTVTGNRTLVANFEEVSSSEYHWDVNIHTYPTTMTVLGIIRIDGVEQYSNFLEIGAFCGDECRGREKTSDIYYNIINHYVVFLTLYGNAGDQLNFRLYDHSLGQELDLNCITTMTFVVNGSYGTPIEPFVFDFVSAVYYNITAMANPTEGGTVDGAGSYEENSTCTLTATASTGYHFVNWTKNGTVVSTNPSYSFVVMGEATYVANFELNSYQITATANPTTGGTITGAGTYNHFANCTLTATANTGYHFVNWTKNGSVVSTNASYSFTVTEAAAYVANFELNSYQITATANPTIGGTITGAGTYNHFANCTLTATANTGYHFVNWTKNGQEVSTNASYSFTVTGAAAYVANFELNSYEITVEVHPVNGGTASGGGTFVHGTSCTLTAEPEEQFIFSNWSKDGDTVSTDLVYTFTVTEDATYVANFERITVTQITDIYNGWNWYSTYIEQEGINGLEMLEESLGSIGQRIKAQDGNYVENYSSLGMGWFGLLTSLTNEASYQILATGTGEISMTGPVVHPSDHPITLYPGWNWIGYPCISDMDIATAFSNLTPTPNDMVKIADNYATYYPQFGGWFGFLNTFSPGMGLLYYSNNSELVTFTYPEFDRSVPSVKNVTFDGSHWTADRHAYPNNMTVSAIVELDNEELMSDSYELAAFANGECRGSVKLTYFEPLNRYMALLVVNGDETTSLQFGLYNSETGMEYFSSDFISYTTNAVLGTPMEPFKVAFRANTGMDEFGSTTQLYPNPVESGKNFSIGTSAEGEIQVEIINAMGSVLRTENLTRQPAMITAPSVAGIYTLRITADGKTCYKKLIVK